MLSLRHTFVWSRGGDDGSSLGPFSQLSWYSIEFLDGTVPMDGRLAEVNPVENGVVVKLLWFRGTFVARVNSNRAALL